MDEPEKEMEDKKPQMKTILYGIVIIVVALALVIIVARVAFNVDLVNFDQLFGARISKQELIRLQK
jgi:hypothetical protein